MNTNIEKQPQKKNDRYNLRSKGSLPTLGEIKEKTRFLMRKVDPLVTPKQKIQNKSGKIAVNKNISMSNKMKNTLSDNTNIRSTPDTSISLLALDYNIVDDMKKTQENISFFKLAKIKS